MPADVNEVNKEVTVLRVPVQRESHYVQTSSLDFYTFSLHGPITGLKNAHYKGKRSTRVAGRGDPRPKLTKLHFNFHNPDRGGPYNLIPMRKSVHNGILSEVGAVDANRCRCVAVAHN